MTDHLRRDQDYSAPETLIGHGGMNNMLVRIHYNDTREELHGRG